MIIRDDPEQCTIREYTQREKVRDWPKMTDAAAIAFKKFVGKKLAPSGDLHRKGNRIFVVGDSNLALCVYNHTRQF